MQHSKTMPMLIAGGGIGGLAAALALTRRGFDVKVLEQAYLRLKPLLSAHPNMALFTNRAGVGCPTCGATRVTKQGFHLTPTSRYQRYQCQACGKWFQEGGALARSKVKGL